MYFLLTHKGCIMVHVWCRLAKSFVCVGNTSTPALLPNGQIIWLAHTVLSHGGSRWRVEKVYDDCQYKCDVRMAHPRCVWKINLKKWTKQIWCLYGSTQKTNVMPVQVIWGYCESNGKAKVMAQSKTCLGKQWKIMEHFLQHILVFCKTGRKIIHNFMPLLNSINIISQDILLNV